MKKFEFKKTQPTFIISVLKVEYYVLLISNFFINKTSLANKWMSFSSSNSALHRVCQRFGHANLIPSSLPKTTLGYACCSVLSTLSDFWELLKRRPRGGRARPF